MTQCIKPDDLSYLAHPAYMERVEEYIDSINQFMLNFPDKDEWTWIVDDDYIYGVKCAFENTGWDTATWHDSGRPYGVRIMRKTNLWGRIKRFLKHL